MGNIWSTFFSGKVATQPQEPAEIGRKTQDKREWQALVATQAQTIRRLHKQCRSERFRRQALQHAYEKKEVG